MSQYLQDLAKINNHDRFMSSYWRDIEVELLISIPKLLGDNESQPSRCSRTLTILPRAWQQHMIDAFGALGIDEPSYTQCSAYLEITRWTSIERSASEQISKNLLRVITESATSSAPLDMKLFSLGAGLEAYLLYGNLGAESLKALWPYLCLSTDTFGVMPKFLDNLTLYCERVEFDLSDDHLLENLITRLVKNLALSSHVLRKVSLQLLTILYRKKHRQDASVLGTALLIEDTPLDLKSARTASMHVRRLSEQFVTVSSDRWLSRAVPYFCFGLLTVKLAQLWDDAIEALKIICETREGEGIVSDIAFQWLESVAVEDDTKSRFRDISMSRSRYPSEFECSHVIYLDELANQRSQELLKANEQLKLIFDSKHILSQPAVSNSASQALRVFNGIPRIAERYSRRLVPMFLQWAILDGDISLDTPVGENLTSAYQTSENPTHEKLARQNRMSMLEVFGHFVNPRVIFRSSDVYSALLGLLTNGDVEMQKSALKAISTWKIAAVQSKMDNLLNLLDDSRFREEISVFLQGDDQDGIIQNNSRTEIMPILLRILYGKIIARTGSISGRRGQATKRKAVFRALSRLSNEDLREFVLIALGPFRFINMVGNSLEVDERTDPARLTVRKQVGVVNMMRDMLDTLGNQLADLTQSIASAVLFCLIQAVKKISPPELVDSLHGSPHKTIRQVGLQCVSLLFKVCPHQALQPYVPLIFSEVINSRLERLPIETAQSVSGTLHLIAVWVSSPETALYLSDNNSVVLGTLINCLNEPSAREEVKLFILDDILKKLVNLSKCSDVAEMATQSASLDIQKRVLGPNLDQILSVTGSLLRKSPGKGLLESTIQLISMIAPIVEGSSQIGSLLHTATFLLNQPSQRVSPRTKGDLLQIVQHFVSLINFAEDKELQQRLYRTISSLFGYFKDRHNRIILTDVLTAFSHICNDLEEVAGYCTDLNSFSTRSIDEPDFDRRLRAFNLITGPKTASFSMEQWRPIIYNMLYYVRDPEELSIRSNASLAIKKFIEGSQPALAEVTNAKSDFLKSVVLPALRNGASETSELVRVEYLSIMACLIRHNPEQAEIADMTPLLMNDDEEASFFSNILHIQQHRRLRALRRLAALTNTHFLNSTNVAHFLVPLIEHFIFDKGDDQTAHNLAAEAVTTVSSLAKCLEWPQLRATFRRFCNYIQTKPGLEKTIVKLLGGLIDAIGYGAQLEQQNIILMPTEADGVIGSNSSKAANGERSILSATMPKKEKLTDDLLHNLLPPLLTYLHNKDESTVSLRVPVAISIVKLIKLLPSDQLAERLAPVLTDVCHILRSRAQESRDLTRKTLVEISTLLGPSCFGFILKELRSSLLRGYQLHVLSYTVHSILVTTAPIYKPGDLDYCLPQIVSIIMDDIFGTTGQEKDAEDYISKMKEVKSSKSYDSMELVAKTATVESLRHLIQPLKTLLHEKLDLKMVKKIDELLRRIGVGLLQNDGVECRETLMFCFEIIQDVYKFNTPQVPKTKSVDSRLSRYLQTTRVSLGNVLKPQVNSSYIYKLARFSFDVLRSVFQRFESLRTSANLSAFMPAIGDALVEAQEEVRISALRLLTTIILVPLNQINENASTYVFEAVKMIRDAPSTNSEMAQAALKLISAILRNKRDVVVKESDVAYLLKKLGPDLEEPDRQGVIFGFLKAVLTRKIIVSEVYDVLDLVAAMMITNQTQGVRDIARGTYFQFIMNYPQSKDRFSQQLGFLVSNLEYEHIEGRQSVMEAIHLLVSKVGDKLVQEIVGTFFVPLVLLTVNDESADCRRMAGTLIKELFKHADAEMTSDILKLLRAWLQQDEKNILIRMSMHMYGLYIDTKEQNARKELPLLQKRIFQIMKAGASDFVSVDWEVLYFALRTATKICATFSTELLGANSSAFWESVRRCLGFPHAWVKLAAARLLGEYFADFARSNTQNENESRQLIGSGGLSLRDEEMQQITSTSLNNLKYVGISEELAVQTARNLIFLGRIMGPASTIWNPASSNVATDGHQDGVNEDDKSEDGSFEISDKTAVQHMFERLSALLRRETLTTKAPSLIYKTASLQIIASLTTHLSTAILTPSLPAILLPLHNLSDPAIPAPYSSDELFRTAYKALVSTSQEIMAMLQEKLGRQEYIEVLSEVRRGVKERREGRRVKRRLETMTEVEKVGREKRRKGERKREKRKERSGEERAKRRGW